MSPIWVLRLASILTLFLFSSLIARGSEIVISVPSKVENIDPVRISSIYDMLATSSYCRSLTRVNERGEIEGHLLGKWSISQDHRTYRFTLKKNIYFHDGSTLTSHDVHYSLSRHYWRKYKSGYRLHLAFALGYGDIKPNNWLIPEIKMLGPRSFEWSLRRPYIPLLALLSQTSLCIVKKDKPLIGTGPMKIDGVKTREGWIFKKFNKYFEGKVNLSSFKLISQFDLDKVKKGLDDKKLDLVIGNHLKDIKGKYSKELRELDFISINHFLFNPEREGFKVRNNRRLLGELMQNIAWKEDNIPKAQQVSKSIVPYGFFSNNSIYRNRSIKSIIKEMKKIEWNRSSPIKVALVKRHFSNNFIKDLSIHFDLIGLPYKITLLKGPEWSNMVINKEYDVTHLPVRPAVYDPDSLFLNFGGLLPKANSLQLFRKLKKTRHLKSKTERMQRYLNIFKEMREKWIIIPAYRLSSLYIKSPRIRLPKTKYKNEFEVWKISTLDEGI